jgi:hypothetical protein
MAACGMPMNRGALYLILLKHLLEDLLIALQTVDGKISKLLKTAL